MQSTTYAKAITYGWTDLCNPDLGPDGKDYTVSVDLERDKYYNYNFFMMPTVYTVAPGHVLKLVLTTWDPNQCFLDESYSIDPDNFAERTKYQYEYYINNSSLSALLPVR